MPPNQTPPQQRRGLRLSAMTKGVRGRNDLMTPVVPRGKCTSVVGGVKVSTIAQQFVNVFILERKSGWLLGTSSAFRPLPAAVIRGSWRRRRTLVAGVNGRKHDLDELHNNQPPTSPIHERHPCRERDPRHAGGSPTNRPRDTPHPFRVTRRFRLTPLPSRRRNH